MVVWRKQFRAAQKGSLSLDAVSTLDIYMSHAITPFPSSPASGEEPSLWFLKILLPAGLQSFGIERWYLEAKRLVPRLVSSPPPFYSSHSLATVPAALARAVLQFHVDCRLVEGFKSPATPDRLMFFF